MNSYGKNDSIKTYSLELTPNVVIAEAMATSHFSKKVMKKVKYYEVFIFSLSV